MVTFLLGCVWKDGHVLHDVSEYISLAETCHYNILVAICTIIFVHCNLHYGKEPPHTPVGTSG